MFREEVVPSRDACFSGGTPAQRGALLHQLEPGGAVNGTVDAAAAQQGLVGRVDDGVDVLRRDVTLYDFNHALGVPVNQGGYLAWSAGTVLVP